MQGVRAAIAACAMLSMLAVVPAPAHAGGAGSGGAGPGGAGLTGGGHPGHHNAHHAHHRPHRHGSSHAPAANPLARRAMWIWELQSVEHGDVSAIIAGAHHYGIGTLIVKSSDGTTPWPQQFNSQFVAELHAAGLKVCAWQYVYGTHPVTEAYLGAGAVRDGADCLVIDAESEYEGRYVAAQTFVNRLRDLIGPRFPVALAGFPYVDYHPAFPYSVFLGPGGAQYNAPQMYWHAIGVSTDAVFAHTYSFNLPYGRPIFPLGQVYGHPPARQIVRFRELSRAYDAKGVSWWDWQEARPYSWTALSRPAGSLQGYVPYETMADIGRGAKGDMVVWIQEHLISAGDPIAVSGVFGPRTEAAVMAFQTAQGLPVDGIVGQETWTALLRHPPATIRWVAGPQRDRATVAPALARRAAARAVARALARRAAARGALAPDGSRPRAAAHAPRGPLLAPVPRSASLPARRDEIATAGGAGRPRPPR